MLKASFVFVVWLGVEARVYLRVMFYNLRWGIGCYCIAGKFDREFNLVVW